MLKKERAFFSFDTSHTPFSIHRPPFSLLDALSFTLTQTYQDRQEQNSSPSLSLSLSICLSLSHTRIDYDGRQASPGNTALHPRPAVSLCPCLVEVAGHGKSDRSISGGRRFVPSHGRSARSSNAGHKSVRGRLSPRLRLSSYNFGELSPTFLDSGGFIVRPGRQVGRDNGNGQWAILGALTAGSHDKSGRGRLTKAREDDGDGGAKVR